MFSKDVAEVRQLAASEPSWMRRLKIRHLEVFLTLVETGSQSATAAQLNITQPALSKWLRELEEDIGAPLFERGRRLTPTTYGEIVLHYAHRVLGDTTRMGDELKTFRAGQSGRVRVGLLRSAAATLIPKVMTAYRRIAPDVRISLFEDTLDNLLPRLERRELDCILGRLHGKALTAEIFTEALYDEPVCIIARVKHPLHAKKNLTKTLTWREALSYPWIVPLPDTPMRQLLEAELGAMGLALPSTTIESSSFLATERLLQETDMISLVSLQLALYHTETKSLAILPLTIPHARLGPLGLLWVDRHPTAAVQRFLDLVRQESAKLARGATPRRNAPREKKR
ncbi:LysR substrate-binding domain-containing protein [Methylocella sp. CPCC 101449]|uniref:LysR substrate-binding domain-containing protein n=1 Tax=Methylocella sp. CPCC 101449 TaxID=2987531 RepID=UPI00288EC89D|nr:LysR substrate-binding domain-containing protein [Methylocella sp. CPCC 101449]MDT2020182.1 LysR substrate-binding domain-containing protein [Methylocella sp. CPCC 101449]